MKPDPEEGYIWSTGRSTKKDVTEPVMTIVGDIDQLPDEAIAALARLLISYSEEQPPQK